MKHYQGVAKKTPVYVCIYLSSHNRFMSKHFLYRPQVSPGLDHVCCEGVTEGVRADLFKNSRSAGKFPGYREDHSPRQSSSPPV